MVVEEQDLNEESTESISKPKRKLSFKTLVRQRWALALIAVLVLIHAAIIGYIRMSSGGASLLSPELTLGEFEFLAARVDPQQQPIQRARFRIHVGLLREAERKGRLLMALHRHKIQQEVEQLLRQAHGRDFSDPLLTELKRQLQAMINETLGQRIVAEIIITDLSIDRVTAETPTTQKKSAKTPIDGDWEDKREG